MARSKQPEAQAVYECDKCGACCRHLLLDASEEDAICEPRIAALPQLQDPDGIAYSLQPDCEAVGTVIDTREQLPLELSPLRIVRGILPRHGGRIVAVGFGRAVWISGRH